jgi:tryptophanyl-tRNA synthetase
MTQFKDKASGRESVLTGLLDYPVLMAGDILLYDADEVPVGDDQRQHVELARDIAQRFNNLFGETFVIPEPMIPEIGGRVMGLNDPTVKMSKSFAHVRGHTVGILDEPREIERSFRGAVTDSGNEIRFSDDPEKAGVNNLLGIYKVITGKSEDEVESDFATARGYGDLKQTVSDVVIAALTPIRERYDDLISDVPEMNRLLQRGADRARSVAQPKIDEMKRRVGLVLPTGA